MGTGIRRVVGVLFAAGLAVGLYFAWRESQGLLKGTLLAEFPIVLPVVVAVLVLTVAQWLNDRFS